MKLIQREAYLSKLRGLRDEKLIKVITGVQRCGKSTLLKLFQEELLKDKVSKKQIISINFEDPKYIQKKDWYEIYEEINAKLVDDKMNYVFLDEVQYIESFERLLVGLQTKDNVDLYVTGSNSHLLSSELATLLSGRSYEINILPYSFSEFLLATEDGAKDRTKEELFLDYIGYGGFPQVATLYEKDEKLIAGYLQGIYETVVGRDILDRKQASDKVTLNRINNFLLDNTGCFYSIRSIAEGLLSPISHHTAKDYIASLTASYLFYPAEQSSLKGKELLRPQSKYYSVDTGLRHALIGKSTAEDRGRALETIVYFELLRHSSNVKIGKINDKEVDFVTKTTNGDTAYYQVAWGVRDEKTLERELAPLQLISDHSPCYLLTMDPESANYDGVKQMNIIKWLLEE